MALLKPIDAAAPTPTMAEMVGADEAAAPEQPKRDPIEAALSIMRRMPPNKIAHNLNAICNLIPEHADELLQRVDQPLEEAKCKDTGRAYLLCDYNRDGDSHRSPWSNKYLSLIHI